MKRPPRARVRRGRRSIRVFLWHPQPERAAQFGAEAAAVNRLELRGSPAERFRALGAHKTRGIKMDNDKTVNIQTFLNANPFSGFQWLIFVMCFVIVLLDGFDTAAIGFIAPSLVTEWHISRPALAPVLSAALFGLAFGALAAGPLSDRL